MKIEDYEKVLKFDAIIDCVKKDNNCEGANNWDFYAYEKISRLYYLAKERAVHEREAFTKSKAGDKEGANYHNKKIREAENKSISIGIKDSRALKYAEKEATFEKLAEGIEFYAGEGKVKYSGKKRYLEYVEAKSGNIINRNFEIYNKYDLLEFIIENTGSYDGSISVDIKVFSRTANGLNMECIFDDNIEGYPEIEKESRVFLYMIISSMDKNYVHFKEKPSEYFAPEWSTEKTREFMKENEDTFNSDKASPNHYKFGDMEVIDMIRETLSIEQFKGFCMGNIIKYRMRAGKKDGSDDIAKAFKYEEYMKTKKGN